MDIKDINYNGIGQTQKYIYNEIIGHETRKKNLIIIAYSFIFKIYLFQTLTILSKCQKSMYNQQ